MGLGGFDFAGHGEASLVTLILELWGQIVNILSLTRTVIVTLSRSYL